MKNAEHCETDAFKLWCWRRLVRVPWTARRSNKSILREINLNTHFKDWCWSWNSSPLATWCEEPTHWKRPWCWERLKAISEEGNRRWDGWVASSTQWIWVWGNSRRWWRTGKPGMLQSMGSQRLRHDWATKQEQSLIPLPKLSKDAVSFLSPWGLLLWCKPSSLGHRMEKKKSPVLHFHCLKEVHYRLSVQPWLGPSWSYMRKLWNMSLVQGRTVLNQGREGLWHNFRGTAQREFGKMRGVKHVKDSATDPQRWERPPRLAAMMANFISQLGRAVVLRYQVSCVSWVGRQTLPLHHLGRSAVPTHHVAVKVKLIVKQWHCSVVSDSLRPCEL